MRIDSKIRAVFVDNAPKGEIFKSRGRWWWRRPSGSVEPWPRKAKMTDIMAGIAGICNGSRCSTQIKVTHVS